MVEVEVAVAPGSTSPTECADACWARLAARCHQLLLLELGPEGSFVRSHAHAVVVELALGSGGSVAVADAVEVAEVRDSS